MDNNILEFTKLTSELLTAQAKVLEIQAKLTDLTAKNLEAIEEHKEKMNTFFPWVNYDYFKLMSGGK